MVKEFSVCLSSSSLEKLYIFLDVRVYHIVNRNLGQTQGCIQFVNKRNLPVIPAMIRPVLARIDDFYINFS
jgi:hypothetical protein